MPAPRSAAIEDPDDFRPLFDGRDLVGWQIERGDPASWSVEDGALVGRNQSGYLARSYLLTDRDYADFVLRLEFAFDDRPTIGALGLRASPGEEVPSSGRSTSNDHPTLRIVKGPAAGPSFPTPRRRDRPRPSRSLARRRRARAIRP
jgi:hypothetical protein